VKSHFITPILFSIFPILFLYSNNVNSVVIKELLFPILLVSIFSYLVLFILKLVLKDWKKSSVLTSIYMILIFLYGHIHLLLYSLDIGGIQIGRNRFLLIIFLVLFIISTLYMIKSKKRFDKINNIISGVAITMIVLSVTNIAIYNFENYDRSSENEISISKEMGISNNKPDIYYIILDEYSGDIPLKNTFGFDNNSFKEFLKENQFHFIVDSHSNYATTMLSVPSVLNMDYISNLVNETKNSQNKIPLYELVQKNQVMKNLKTQGYTIININGGVWQTSNIQIADENLCNPILNMELVETIFKTSILNPIEGIVLSPIMKENRLCVFSELIKITERNEGPMFVFAHILLPHSPYLFGAEGESVGQVELSLGYNTGLDKEKYVNQLKFVNNKIIDLINEIIESSEQSPIIIIQSDHGVRMDINWENPSEEDIKRTYKNLIAYHIPETENNIPIETPVNTFRIIFNNYFNSSFEILEDKMYYSNPNKSIYNFTDITINVLEDKK